MGKDGYTGPHILHMGEGPNFLVSLRHFIRLAPGQVQWLTSTFEEVATDSLEEILLFFFFQSADLPSLSYSLPYALENIQSLNYTMEQSESN